jgi:ATP-binding cassette, subfamily B, bacterial
LDSRSSRGLSIEERAKRRAKGRDLRPLLRLIPYFMQYRGRLALAILALAAAAGATLAVPVAVRSIIDHGFADPLLITRYFGTMLAIVTVLAIASGCRFYLVNWLSERVVADLRQHAFSHLLELSAYFYEQTRTGEVVSRLTADATQIKATFGFAASVALRNAVLLAGSVVLMVLTSPHLSGLTLIALPLIVAPLVVFGRRVRRLSRLAQDRLAGSAATAQETLSAISIVQAYGQERRIAGAFDRETEEAFQAARRRSKARALLTASIIFLSLGSIVAILWLGARDVADGNLSAGTLGQFVLYAAIAASAIGELSQVWGEIQLAAGAAERIGELLDTQPLIKAPRNAQRLPPPKGGAAFKNVSFRYPSRPDIAALSCLSFSAEPGETVAIVGPSGAGKTTIFNLLLRYYNADEGIIEVDGADIAKADPKEVRERFAIVPQEGIVFSASIADNIRFGKPDASEDDVLAAAKIAHVSEFALRLPQGFGTLSGERGVTLSGGQRQRIALARAILKDAPILLLDEATSSLDAESEHAVQDALQKLKSGRTTLVVAHRLATVRNADRIIVLDQGRMVAEGNHETLMKRGGLYARLANLQFSDVS